MSRRSSVTDENFSSSDSNSESIRRERLWRCSRLHPKAVCFGRAPGLYDRLNCFYGVLRVCLSDLEGDLEGFCLGLPMNGEPPEVLCDFFDPPFPAGQTLNTCLETDPFALGFRGVNATWVIGLNVVDRMGQTSNTVVTTFFCCR